MTTRTKGSDYKSYNDIMAYNITKWYFILMKFVMKSNKLLTVSSYEMGKCVMTKVTVEHWRLSIIIGRNLNICIIQRRIE